MGWWLLRLSAKILALLRLKVKIFQFLRLSTKFLAVFGLSVNPIEILLNCKHGWNIKDLFPASAILHLSSRVHTRRPPCAIQLPREMRQQGRRTRIFR